MSDIKKFVFAERQKALFVASLCGLGIIEEETELEGYRIYIVEQWMCDRKTYANTVKVFTGDKSHKIKVCVIGITTADLQHARPDVKRLFSNNLTPLKYKSTPIGQILLTDPSELPSDVGMDLVPDGNYDKWVRQACVNINLRRTFCTGRNAFNLRKPNPASEEKFRSLYKIADTVNFENAVINLVTLAQTALYLFGLLRRDCIDGMICDETNFAFGEFYKKYNPYKGSTYTLKEPWMEPRLLTSLITKLVVCRNKLHSFNVTTIKDPFTDFEEFSDDIGAFQKLKGLRQTRVIDLETLDKINGYHFGPLRVRKAIKSKLDDISGVNNVPLFSEDFNPEVFRDHATMESLRNIWRPKLKNSQNADNDKQPNDLLHIIKEVSARTTKTSGAAAEILSKVAGSLSWGSNSPIDKSPSLTSSLSIKNNNNHNASISNSLQSPSPSHYSISSPINPPIENNNINNNINNNNNNNNNLSTYDSTTTDDDIANRNFKDISRRSTQITKQNVDNLGLEIKPSKSTIETTSNFNEIRKQSTNISNWGIDDDLPSIVKSNQNLMFFGNHDHVQVSPISTPEPITTTTTAVKEMVTNATTSITAAPISIIATSPFIPPQQQLQLQSQPTSPTTHHQNQKEEIKLEQIGIDDFVKYDPKIDIKTKHMRAKSMDETSLMTYRYLGESSSYNNNRSRPNSSLLWKNETSSIDGVKSWYEVDDDDEYDENNNSDYFDDNDGDYRGEYLEDDDNNNEIENNKSVNNNNENENNDNDYNDDDDGGDEHSVFSDPNGNMELIYNRPRSIAGISSYQQSNLPMMIHVPFEKKQKMKVMIGTTERGLLLDNDNIHLASHMDTETYLLYEQLRNQHSALENKYKKLKSLAKEYEEMAKQLRNTYARRSAEFGQIERQFKLIVDDQMEMEKQLKRVEDDSAKLHYELNVLNENLVEREENVAGFYSKLEILERKMKDDQQSLTTMFIMGNFFKYYWQRITDFLGRSRS